MRMAVTTGFSGQESRRSRVRASMGQGPRGKGSTSPRTSLSWELTEGRSSNGMCSEAARVVREATCPVLIVREPWNAPDV